MLTLVVRGSYRRNGDLIPALNCPARIIDTRGVLSAGDFAKGGPKQRNRRQHDWPFSVGVDRGGDHYRYPPTDRLSVQMSTP